MRLHHLAFRTRDVEALTAFYRDVLGLAVLKTQTESTWLDAAGTILMIEHAEPDEVLIRASKELTCCFAILPAQFVAMTARLALANAAIEDRTKFTVYFRDPDGRRLGLSSYPEPSEG